LKFNILYIWVVEIGLKKTLAHLQNMKQLTMAEQHEVLRRIKSKKSYVDYIVGILGCNKEEAKNVAKSITITIDDVTEQAVSEVVVDSGLKHVYDKKKKNVLYTFNPNTNDYCFYLKSAGKPTVVKKDHMEAMVASYSDFAGDSKSADALARHYSLTCPMVKEILNVLGITKESLPVTPEQLDSLSNEEISAELQARRKFEITQTFNKDDWEDTQKLATKFQRLENHQLNPFVEALNNIQLPALPPVRTTYPISDDEDSGEVFMVCLSDLHFGACVHTNEVHGGQEYNIERITEIVDDLAERIANDLNNRFLRPKKAVVAIVGDILHTLTGKTQRGTSLDYDRIGAEQFRAAMISMTRFMQQMLRIFDKVDVYTVRGNHAGSSEAGLYYAIANAFINNDRISFTIKDTRVTSFKVAGGYVMLDHGDSDIIPEKARVPAAANAREAYIRKRFDGYVSEWHDAKFKLFIQGDLHHYERRDYGGFEFIMLPAPIGIDRYCHHLNLGSLPAQKCFILNKDGIKEELTYAFR
jgi:hypothetical protein